jgi:hypothetical protein
MFTKKLMLMKKTIDQPAVFYVSLSGTKSVKSIMCKVMNMTVASLNVSILF